MNQSNRFGPMLGEKVYEENKETIVNLMWVVAIFPYYCSICFFISYLLFLVAGFLGPYLMVDNLEWVLSEMNAWFENHY